MNDHLKQQEAESNKQQMKQQDWHLLKYHSRLKKIEQTEYNSNQITKPGPAFKNPSMLDPNVSVNKTKISGGNEKPPSKHTEMK